MQMRGDGLQVSRFSGGAPKVLTTTHTAYSQITSFVGIV